MYVTGEDLQRGGGETGRGVRSPVLDSPEQWGEVRILARAMRVKRNIFISSEFLLLFNFLVLSFFLYFSYFFVRIIQFSGSAVVVKQALRCL